MDEYIKCEIFDDEDTSLEKSIIFLKDKPEYIIHVINKFIMGLAYLKSLKPFIELGLNVKEKQHWYIDGSTNLVDIITFLSYYWRTDLIIEAVENGADINCQKYNNNTTIIDNMMWKLLYNNDRLEEFKSCFDLLLPYNPLLSIKKYIYDDYVSINGFNEYFSKFTLDETI
jgi:hypothetical protein